ncbi:LysR substrate-binding domain-containing protein [Marinobacter nanhaiticus D15-8W]|uniref:LysR family transcriptional regulator n=1 Tax=Marinobacter nanhaiticus D15-8W TaxID=626887 RepID=N6VZR6_9GAMM|nr:LysR substrate-binding domain-containing protein [Marinobacter nanhaiticus]ENO15765.1 LysR family transcriptional regulator [Marinobacter nanhaiticus D15-8W]BES73377.1 LysR substrate-binding domain-containing protein [Marinobacter nanhaiticus D15-8W]
MSDRRRLLPGLPAFEAAARLNNFTRAAEELHLTHGAISRAIAQLEEHLGTTLFVRHARRVSLTPAGYRLMEATRNAFAELDRAVEETSGNGSLDQVLHISCEPSLSMRWLMPRLGRLRQSHPELQIELSTAGGPIDLDATGCDLAIRRLDFATPKDAAIEMLCPELAGPVCHPECWNGVLGQDLSRARWLHTRTRPSAWSDWCTAANKPYCPAGEQSFDHFYFTLQAALDQLGTAIGPLPLVYDDLQAGRLIAPLGMSQTGVDYVLLTPRRQDQVGQTRRIMDWLSTQASPLEQFDTV